MSGVNLLLGQAGGGKVWRGLLGLSDDGTAFNLRSQSQWLPPSPGNVDFLFYKVFVTVTWDAATQLRVSAKVDALGSSIDPNPRFNFTLRNPIVDLEEQTERTTQTFEFPLTYDMKIGGVDVARTGLRGRRIKVAVETVPGFSAGSIFVIDGVAVEMEALEESLPGEGT